MSADTSSSDSSIPNWKVEIYQRADHYASDVLDVLREDIRFCTNCFAKVRTVIPAEDRVSDGNPADFITDRPVPDPDHGGERDAKAVLAPNDPTNDDWSYTPKGKITVPAPINGERGEIVTSRGGEGETYYGTICGECGEHSTGASRRPVKAATGRSYMRQLSRSMEYLRQEYEDRVVVDSPDRMLAEHERQRIARWKHTRSDLLDAYRRVKQRRSAQDHDYDETEFHRALRLYFASRLLSDRQRAISNGR